MDTKPQYFQCKQYEMLKTPATATRGYERTIAIQTPNCIGYTAISWPCIAPWPCSHYVTIHFTDLVSPPITLLLRGRDIAKLYGKLGRVLDHPHFKDEVAEYEKQCAEMNPAFQPAYSGDMRYPIRSEDLCFCPAPCPCISCDMDARSGAVDSFVSEDNYDNEEAEGGSGSGSSTDAGADVGEFEQPWNWEWDDAGNM